jgi:hypothetical protein
MKRYLLTIAILSWLIPCDVFGGQITEGIIQTCPDKYATYSDTVHEYVLRIEDYVHNYGCEVINIYALFADNHMEVIDALEEDDALMQSTVNLFVKAPGLVPAMAKAPHILETLVITAKTDKAAFKKLIEVYSGLKPGDYRNMEKNPNYFLYPLAATLMTDKNARAGEVRYMARRIEKNISPDDISIYSYLLMTGQREYTGRDPEKIMSYVDLTMSTIGRDTLRKMQPYKTYLIYFLPPPASVIKESQNICTIKIHKIQQDYVKLMTFVFEYFETLDKPELGMRVAEFLQGDIMDALRYHRNGDEIQKYLSYQFNSRLFSETFSLDHCDTDTIEKMKFFFSMYSPIREDTGKIVEGAEGNLGLIARWFLQGGKTYMDRANPENWVKFVKTMCFLPVITTKLNPTQQKVFDDLLLNFYDHKCQTQPDVVNNAILIVMLYQKTNYFKWVDQNIDAFSMIEHNEDVEFGRDNKKYKYIFMTSYPTDYDPSLFCRLKNEGVVPAPTVQQLMWMSNESLEDHNFTEFEKKFATGGKIVEMADYAFLFGSIIAIPVTGGTSTAVLVTTLTRMAARTAAKKAIKNIAKQGFRKTAKRISKSVLKNSWKAEKNQIFQIAKQSGRKIEEKTLVKALNRTEKYVMGMDLSRVAIEIAMVYFFAQNYDNKETSNPCGDQLAYR